MVDDSERISGYSFDVDPIYGGGGFLVRQWHDNRQHWKPLAHAPVADPTRLYGGHTIEVQDTPQARGMLHKVRHLVRIEEKS